MIGAIMDKHLLRYAVILVTPHENAVKQRYRGSTYEKRIKNIEDHVNALAKDCSLTYEEAKEIVNYAYSKGFVVNNNVGWCETHQDYLLNCVEDCRHKDDFFVTYDFVNYFTKKETTHWLDRKGNKVYPKKLGQEYV